MGQDFGTVEALLKAVCSAPTIKAKFLSQRDAFVEQKKLAGGGSLRSFTVSISAVHSQGETMRAEGPKYDFWEPQWYIHIWWARTGRRVEAGNRSNASIWCDLQGYMGRVSNKRYQDCDPRRSA